jgi:uncharacterized protein (DUF1810 family)/predicted enzyme related to lactoylglutathione lyase
VTEISVFRPGSVSYLRIAAPDVSQSAIFYRTVFGWKTEIEASRFEDATGHVIGHFMMDLPVAGEAGVVPYIYVKDIDETLARVTGAGGQVSIAPYPEGALWVAMTRDPAGNAIGVWQHGPRNDQRAELLDMNAEDPYDLQRFVAAQDAAGTYQHAVAELRGGRKSSHWMWFVFPQIAGLGYSPTARAYAITSLAEARAYLAHPVLGARLAECAAILTGVSGRTAEQIFGEVDAMKLHSSMTLFMRAAPEKPVFRQVLDQYFDGIPDSATEQRI